LRMIILSYFDKLERIPDQAQLNPFKRLKWHTACLFVKCVAFHEADEKSIHFQEEATDAFDPGSARTIFSEFDHPGPHFNISRRKNSCLAAILSLSNRHFALLDTLFRTFLIIARSIIGL
jgi:hypothetical protein